MKTKEEIQTELGKLYDLRNKAELENSCEEEYISNDIEVLEWVIGELYIKGPSKNYED